jgi:hypothetical protein
MKIDIHISDATPVEAQRVLIGMSFADEILGKISPAIKIERAEQKPEPDPAPGHTGCEDCDHDLRDFAECERCSPPPTPEPAKKPKATVKGKPGPTPGSGKGNSFGIPVLLYTTDKKQYQRLWARCKTHGITYEEALKMEEGTKKPRGKQGNPKVKRQGHLPLHLKNPQPDTSKPLSEAIPQSNDVKEPPKETVPWPGQKKLRELTKAKNGTIAIGARVKHNGSTGSPHYGQVGEVIGITDKDLHVKFPTGSTRLPSYLVLVMPEAAVPV